MALCKATLLLPSLLIPFLSLTAIIFSEKLHSFMSKFRQFMAINLVKVIFSAYFLLSGKAFPKMKTPFLLA